MQSVLTNVVQQFKDNLQQKGSNLNDEHSSLIKEFKLNITEYLQKPGEECYQLTVKKFKELNENEGVTKEENEELKKIAQILANYKEIDYLIRMKQDVQELLESHADWLASITLPSNDNILNFYSYYQGVKTQLELMKANNPDLAEGLEKILTIYKEVSQPSVTNQHDALVKDFIADAKKIVAILPLDNCPHLTTAIQALNLGLVANNPPTDLEGFIKILETQLPNIRKDKGFLKDNDKIEGIAKKFDELSNKLSKTKLARALKSESQRSTRTIETSIRVLRDNQHQVVGLSRENLNLTQTEEKLRQENLNLTKVKLELTQQLENTNVSVTNQSFINNSMATTVPLKTEQKGTYDYEQRKLYDWVKEDCFYTIDKLNTEITKTKEQLKEIKESLAKTLNTQYKFVPEVSPEHLQSTIDTLELSIFNILSNVTQRKPNSDVKKYLLAIEQLYQNGNYLPPNVKYKEQIRTQRKALESKPEANKSNSKPTEPITKVDKVDYSKLTATNS